MSPRNSQNHQQAPGKALELKEILMSEQDIPKLDDFVEIADLQSAVSRTFPTIDSVRWFVRRHRADLVENGSLILVGRRMMFHVDRFKNAAVQIGQRRMS
jgi:hypothetical protein